MRQLRFDCGGDAFGEAMIWSCLVEGVYCLFERRMRVVIMRVGSARTRR